MRAYFYALLARYLGLHIRPTDRLIEIEPSTSLLIRHFEKNAAATSRHVASFEFPAGIVAVPFEHIEHADYVLLAGNIHYERDIQSLLAAIGSQMNPSGRLILVYYSALWRPVMRLAARLGFRTTKSEPNWVAHEDVDNLLLLTDFEVVRRDSKVLVPLQIPVLSYFANRWLAPLPVFRIFSLAQIVVARPIAKRPYLEPPSVSIVVPARNEEGNIKQILERLPVMGPQDEVIFIEGNSTDDTWATIQHLEASYRGMLRIKIAQQYGKGKGDAVRRGFDMAENDILMILDADATVPPEDLPRFFDAVVSGKGEFINGSRLVYPMEKQAMRFLNLIGNKFFAFAFSFVLGQRFKDTLCGTKVLSREAYLRLARNRAYFGNFDPFGDFDLIFGAARMGLKIVEVPIRYRERTYGETNISRWRHGWLLLVMLVFSARRIKFL